MCWIDFASKSTVDRVVTHKQVILFGGICVSILFSLSLCVSSGLGAGDDVSFAPLNPAFVEYIRVATIEAEPSQVRSQHGSGLIPSPVDLSHLTGKRAFQAGVTAAPSSYDLRTLGKVTPVKNQGACNRCWAFARKHFTRAVSDYLGRIGDD